MRARQIAFGHASNMQLPGGVPDQLQELIAAFQAVQSSGNYAAAGLSAPEVQADITMLNTLEQENAGSSQGNIVAVNEITSWYDNGSGKNAMALGGVGALLYDWTQQMASPGISLDPTVLYNIVSWKWGVDSPEWQGLLTIAANQQNFVSLATEWNAAVIDNEPNADDWLQSQLLEPTSFTPVPYYSYPPQPPFPPPPFGPPPGTSSVQNTPAATRINARQSLPRTQEDDSSMTLPAVAVGLAVVGAAAAYFAMKA